MIPYDIVLLIDLFLAQSLSEKLPPAADGRRYRDPQPNMRHSLGGGENTRGKERTRRT